MPRCRNVPRSSSPPSCSPCSRRSRRRELPRQLRDRALDRIYGRNGVQRSQLHVPARFAVTGRTPQGQATDNATLEGLTIGPKGHQVIASMEGALVDCPTLGAPAKETQANPLLDNFEGMAITGSGKHHRYGVSMISDDNFSSEQTTRVLNLAARLSGSPRR